MLLIPVLGSHSLRYQCIWVIVVVKVGWHCSLPRTCPLSGWSAASAPEIDVTMISSSRVYRICCAHSCVSLQALPLMSSCPLPPSAPAEPGMAHRSPGRESREEGHPLSAAQLWKGWRVCRAFTWPSEWWGVPGRRRVGLSIPRGQEHSRVPCTTPDPRSSSWDRRSWFSGTDVKTKDEGDDVTGLSSHCWTVKGHEPGEGC